MLAAAAIVPRLVVLLYERGDVTSEYVEKSDDFARTFVASGTFGLVPDIPSAYTQPLYGFFLVPLHWAFDRSWVAVGLAQITVAVATAVVVYELGRRYISARVGLLAGLLTTVHPYLVWHDVHMNREILDQLLAAAAVLLTLVLADRGSLPVAVALGAVSGAAVLGNVRLVLVPLLLAGFVLLCRGRNAFLPALAVLGAAAVVVAPWVVRNKVSVGCTTLSTDARALWKANNPATLDVLQNGKWIDDVPAIPGAPPTPEEAAAIYNRTGRVVATDECAQMRFYRRRALVFIRDRPGEKAKLAGVAARMLWQPAVTRTEGRAGAGTRLDTARRWVEPAYMIALYALALVGFGSRLIPRRLAWLSVLLFSYVTLTAMLFAGETRYRVSWDFLIALAASAAAVHLASRITSERTGAVAPR